MPAITYRRFERELLDFYRSSRRPGTWLKVRQALRELGAWAPPRSTTDLTPGLINRFIAASRSRPNRSDPTTASLVASIRACCGFASRMGWLKADPFAVVRDWGIDREPAAVPRHLSRRQAALALAKADELATDWRGRRLRALVHLLAYTGLRRGEALHLRPGDVDLASGFVRVPRARRKWRSKTKGSAAPVPIPAALAPILAAWLAECGPDWLFPGVAGKGPWLGGQVGARPLDHLHALGVAAGVGRLNFQLWRHTFATHAPSWGLGPIQLKQILRHTTIRTQAWYVHPDEALLREAVRSIGFAAPA